MLFFVKHKTVFNKRTPYGVCAPHYFWNYSPFKQEIVNWTWRFLIPFNFELRSGGSNCLKNSTLNPSFFKWYQKRVSSWSEWKVTHFKWRMFFKWTPSLPFVNNLPNSCTEWKFPFWIPNLSSKHFTSNILLNLSLFFKFLYDYL